MKLFTLSAKSSPLVAEAQRKATEATAEVTRGQERPVEVRNKIGISHRKPDYTEMQDFFLSFPADMHLSEKTRLLREKFPAVKNSTLIFQKSISLFSHSPQICHCQKKAFASERIPKY